MTIERLKLILNYSKTHSKDIMEDIAAFCHQIDLPNLDGVRNVLQMVRPYLVRKRFLTIHLPLNDDEIGAFVYRGDALSYLVINTSLSVLNTNFALCHELYHIFFPSDEALNKARVDLDYYSNEEEIRANIFSGNLLMPANEFRQMFLKLKAGYEYDDTSELKILVSLMNYFKAPFMAVYIRCFELELLGDKVLYLDIKSDDIEAEYRKLWFETTDLKPSKIDNSDNLIKFVEEKGNEYLEKQYINTRTLQMVLENIKVLFSKAKAGE